MADDSTVRRVLFLKATLPSADPDRVLTMVQATAPLYGLFGSTKLRLLHNVDEPGRFILEIEYETHTALEVTRQRLAGDLRVQSLVQAWRTLLGGAVDLEVYEDLSGKA